MLKRIRVKCDFLDVRSLPDVGEFLDRGEPVLLGPLCKAGGRFLFCRVRRDGSDDLVEAVWSEDYDPDSGDEPEDGDRAFRVARLR